MEAHDRLRIDLERSLGASRVLVDPDVVAPFGGDDSPFLGVCPIAVVRPAHAQDVSRTLALCTAHRVPVVPRGAGTGRTGGAVSVRPSVVLDATALRDIRGIERDDQLAVVQPGVVLGDLHAAVADCGMFYPPDPNSAASCTLGGNVAENVGGPRAYRYGGTRDYVLGLEAVTMDGTVHRVGRRTVKGVTGYDLTALLVGSEGTLAVFTEITLRLIPDPGAVVALFATFEHVSRAALAVQSLVAAGERPRCLEILDARCCEAAASAGAVPWSGTPGGLLLIEVDGAPAVVEDAVERIGNALDRAGARDVSMAQDAAGRERIWSVRRQMSLTLRTRARHKLSEDVVVPRSRLADLYAFVEALGEREQLALPAYGHAGDGNLHVNFLWSGDDERVRVDRAIDALFRETVALGGTLTGEHGLGLAKQDYLPLEQAEPVIDLQRRIKDVFDPHLLLNPGKMFPSKGHRAC